MDQFAPLFDRQSGYLTLEQISTGISACIDNALDLFRDAIVLHHHKCYARALSLLLTSLQEAGKVTLLVQMILLPPNDHKKWRQIWKRFHDHETKDAFGQSAKINQETNGNPGEAFWQQVAYKKVAPAKEKIRQFALYVDFIKRDKAWWSPREITPSVVEQAIDDVVTALYTLYREREMGLFSVAAIKIHREEFATFTPGIELDQEYEITDFGFRFFGLGPNGPYKRAWQRLIEQGIITEIPDELYIMGKPWKEWLMSGEREESTNKSIDSNK